MGVAAAAVLAVVLIGLVLIQRLSNEVANPIPAEAPMPDFKVLDANDSRLQRLTFETMPLSEVIDAINRRNGPLLILEDDALGRMKISGSVRADSPDALVEMLVQTKIVSATKRTDGTIVLRGIEHP